jgi:hypothetical protein
MDITLHEKNHGQQIVNLDAFEAVAMNDLKPKSNIIKNLMAYSKALKVNDYKTLGKQELILN